MGAKQINGALFRGTDIFQVMNMLPANNTLPQLAQTIFLYAVSELGSELWRDTGGDFILDIIVE